MPGWCRASQRRHYSGFYAEPGRVGSRCSSEPMEKTDAVSPGPMPKRLLPTTRTSPNSSRPETCGSGAELADNAAEPVGSSFSFQERINFRSETDCGGSCCRT